MSVSSGSYLLMGSALVITSSVRMKEFVYLFFLYDYNFHFYLQLHILRSLFAFYFSVLLQMTVPGKKLVLVVSSPHYHNQGELLLLHAVKIVGNKAKGRISKRVLQEIKAHQIFRKTNIVCFSENLACFVFL